MQDIGFHSPMSEKKTEKKEHTCLHCLFSNYDYKFQPRVSRQVLSFSFSLSNSVLFSLCTKFSILFWNIGGLSRGGVDFTCAFFSGNARIKSGPHTGVACSVRIYSDSCTTTSGDKYEEENDVRLDDEKST